MSGTASSQEKDKARQLKQEAADQAAQWIENGMVVGLGSGSTATLAVAAVGQRVKEGLRLTGIPTSEQTGHQAQGLNIPLATLGEYPEIDLTIDGADEVERGTLNLIKGGGGNQLREKIVASASRRLLIVVDESKLVDRLGTHAPVPVEVAQFGWQATARSLEKLKGNPTLRRHPDGAVFITDGGNYILDCAFGQIEEPEKLQLELDGVVGVVEHGLFLGMASAVLVGRTDGVQRLERQTRK